VLFSGCHALFELIPRISRFAAARLDEETVSQDSFAFYEVTHAAIDAWHHPPGTDAQTAAPRAALGRVYKHAVVIFLELAHAGRALPPSDDLLATLSYHVGGLAKAVFSHGLLNSPFSSILLWPMIMAGSVIADPDRMEVMSWRLRSGIASTSTSVHVAEVLEALWLDRETDPRCWGPYGLYLTLQRHGVNLSLA